MGLFDRLGSVVRSEWQALLHRDGPGVSHAPLAPAPRARPRVPAASDVAGALRVLELDGQPSLAEVRAQYQRLARRYHPRTLDGSADDTHAARVVVDALTEALELLEAHLLPIATEDAPPAVEDARSRRRAASDGRS
ncbi:MAG: J domain-containing protein [Deltaproteobacteria bacterium]|nr:J domain-containing protein [Deltaproteobacteria bacterium]